MAKLTLPLSIATLAAGLAPSARGGDDVRCFEEMVPMRDGTRLYTYGVLPPEGAKCGIVFMRTPYAEEKPVDVSSWAADQRSALARGYAYVVQHVRGTTAAIQGTPTTASASAFRCSSECEIG